MKISTGNKVVQSVAWYSELLPHGKSMHIGLEHTADTISAGQANSEHGIGTSWLTPESYPVPGPAPIVLHKLLDLTDDGVFNHIVWSGSRSVLLP